MSIENYMFGMVEKRAKEDLINCIARQKHQDIKKEISNMLRA